MARWHFSIPIPVFLAFIPNSLFRTPTPAAPAPPVAGYRHPIQSVEARREANRRVSRVLSDTDTGDLPPSPDEGLTIEARITGGLDRAALVFLKILENEERDPVTNALLVDAKTRAAAFKMLVDWIVKRKKAAVDDGGDGPPPYEKIRKWLDEAGFKIVPKNPGRPTKEMLATREAIMGKPEPEPKAPPAEDKDLAARLQELAARKGRAQREEVTADVESAA